MAHYLVTQEPGVQVPGLGFFKPGDSFTLPDDATPSRNLTPLDEAAVEALKRTKEAYVTSVEKRLAEQEPPRKLPATERAALLAVPAIPGAKVEAPKQDDSLTARQLMEQQTGKPTQPSAGKRAADR